MSRLTDFFRNLLPKAEQIVSASEKFNSASALSTYALSTFDRIVDDLKEANGHLDEVVTETADEITAVRAAADAEIARLAQLRDAAISQHFQNGTVIGNVRRLIAVPVAD